MAHAANDKGQAERLRRLAEALRKNLKRRKEQQRKRAKPKDQLPASKNHDKA